MRFSIFIVALFSFNSLGAQDSSSSFEIEKGLLEEIYQGSVSEAKIDSSPYSSGVWVYPQISYFNTTELLLTNNYFTVPYSGDLQNIPSIQLGIGFPVGTWGRFSSLL